NWITALAKLSSHWCPIHLSCGGALSVSSSTSVCLCQSDTPYALCYALDCHLIPIIATAGLLFTEATSSPASHSLANPLHCSWCSHSPPLPLDFSDLCRQELFSATIRRIERIQIDQL